MAKPEDLLQERLERLETGEPLESCLENVSEDIATSLHKAARLRGLAWPARSETQITNQKLKVMGIIEKPQVTSDTKKENQPNKTSGFWKKSFQTPILFAAGLSVVACAFFFLIGSVFFLVNQVEQNVAVRQPFFSEKSKLMGRPEEAVLSTARGLVESLNAKNEWVIVNTGAILKAGDQVRTGALSSAKLDFFDGSYVALGPNAEITIDELKARTGLNPRQIVLTQLRGESSNEVVRSTNPDSRYEVHTLAATGTAKGTAFNVLVRPDESAIFSVHEGAVAVTGQEVTVLVESGQATTASLDEPPDEPVFFFTGQGEVTFIGETWIVAGQKLTTHPGTVVIGNPLVGDQVFFEGRLLSGEIRLVDLIILIRRSPANRFSLTGTFERIKDGFWMVNGEKIVVTDITEIDDGIVENDLVYIEGLILPGGVLQAETIRRLENPPGLPFEFSGVIQKIGDESWTISEIIVDVTNAPNVDAGLVVGDLVHVTGWILEGGVWQASNIQRILDETRSFEFIGKIDGIDPWIVAGIPFETKEWTEIDLGLSKGDRVRVIGQILADGTWVAAEIRLLEDLTETRFVLVGVVLSTNPWVVSGITLNVDVDTVIDEEINPGMLVRVEIQVLPDGTWKVLRIASIKGFEWGQGCHELNAVVVSVSGYQLQLQGLPELTIGEDTEIDGELKVNSVVLVKVCFGEDGSILVVTIVIIYQPEEIEEPPLIEFPGEKVMICHKPNGKNPHAIVVSQSAVPAHLGHGDVLGDCP